MRFGIVNSRSGHPGKAGPCSERNLFTNARIFSHAAELVIVNACAAVVGRG